MKQLVIRSTFFLFFASIFLLCSKEKDKSNEKSITTCILTIDGTDYDITFDVAENKAVVTLPEKSDLPTEATLKDLALSSGASSSVVKGAQINITSGVATIVTIAEDGTIAIFTIEFVVTPSPPPTPNVYTITFNSKGGTPITAQNIKSGEKVVRPENPKRDGNIFVDWYKDETFTTAFDFDNEGVTANLTLHAKWNVIITFDSKGGSAVDAQTITSGDKPTKPKEDPKREGNIFAGWFVDEALTTAFNFDINPAVNIVINTSTTLYAKWNVTITFNSNQGSDVEAQTITSGGKATKPKEDPKRDGNIFAGWFKDATFKDTFDFNKEIIHANTTLYAKWNVKILFNSDLFTTKSSQIVVSGGKATRQAAPDSLPYTFGGWYKEPELKDTFDFGKETITKNITLYAKWILVFEPATTNAPFGFRDNHTSVEFDGKIWVIGGSDDLGRFKNDVWSSSDGVTWTKVKDDNDEGFSRRIGHTSVAFKGKLWVIGGWKSNTLNDVWSSSDGITWTEETANSGSISPRFDHTSVVFKDKLWVIGGWDGSSSLNDVWSSSDGVTWTKVTNIDGLFGLRSNHTSVVFNNKIWVIGGGVSSSAKNDVWSSSDGEIWTREVAMAFFNPRHAHTTVLFDNKVMFLIGGSSEGNNSKYNDVWSSSDGIKWKKETTIGSFDARSSHTSVILNNKIFVIGGRTGNSPSLKDVWHTK